MKEIYELMERFHALSIGEMELEYHGMKIFLKSAPGSVTEEKSCEEIGEKPKVIKENITEAVKAPLTGTFYRCPAPGKAPYVAVGQKVKKGEVLGVIEAMKMMNEIVAVEEGVVEEILVEDETMVEYEQPLIVIR